MTQDDALQQVFARDYARLCAAAQSVLHDAAQAQDAVQEAWLRLHRAGTLDFSDTEKLRHLVLITVRHTALNLRRTPTSQPVGDEPFAALPDPGPAPHEVLEHREQVRRLAAALRTLNETDRAILQLQYGQGLRSGQIAALLGLRPAAVRQRARRARLALRTILEQEGLYEEYL